MCFVRGVTIESAKGPRVFENCMARFQRVCFEDIASSIQSLRDGDMPETPRWWIERTKKASKDADLALIALWLTAFPRRPFLIQVGAADSDQAGIVKDRISHLLQFNPWLNDHVEMIHSQVKSKKKMNDGKTPLAVMNILAADAAGAHGGTPDLLIINELSHITRWEFAENLMDNVDGVAQGMAIIATNAGFRGTKAEVWRNAALYDSVNNANPAWSLHVLSKPAPWHNQAVLQDARRRNTPSRFKRLWQGRWVSGKGDAIDDDHIDRCFCLPGPILEPEDGWIYIGGLDLGVSHDHSGLVVIGVHEREQKIKLAWMKAWSPNTNTGEVDLIDVEDACKQVSRIYKLSILLYDPHQAKLMAQRLVRANIPMREMSFSSGTNITNMTTAFMQVVESGKLLCYDNEDGRLRRDFGKFNIVEKSYGYKLEAVSDEFGHADVGTALVITLPAAMEVLNGFSSFTGEEEICHVQESPLSEEEVDALPAGLKDIYGVEEEVRIEERRSRDPFEDII